VELPFEADLYNSHTNKRCKVQKYGRHVNELIIVYIHITITYKMSQFDKIILLKPKFESKIYDKLHQT
jgi:hypothetical protein